jgi:antitoxin component of MazEF toxin-antitoxin module
MAFPLGHAADRQMQHPILARAAAGVTGCGRHAPWLYSSYDVVHTEVRAMVKKLTAIGNSLGLIIEKPILELLDIDKDTPLEVRTDGKALIIRPQRKERSGRLQASAERMMQAHDGTLRELAK